MNSDQLRNRTKDFAAKIVSFFRDLPKAEEAKIMGKQLLRSATSLASNYRAACRSRSKAEFYSKISIVVEEADESLFWLELLEQTGVITSQKVDWYKKESEELLKIFSSARKTAKENMKSKVL